MSKARLVRGKTTVAWKALVFDAVDDEGAGTQAMEDAELEVCCMDEDIQSDGMTHEVVSVEEVEAEP